MIRHFPNGAAIMLLMVVLPVAGFAIYYQQGLERFITSVSLPDAASTKQWVLSILLNLDAAWEQHRDTVEQVSHSSEYLRSAPAQFIALLVGISILLFQFESLKTLVLKLADNDVLSAYRKIGITDALLESARLTVIAFMFFIFYLLVQFPFTFLNDGVRFLLADLAISALLFLFVWRSHRGMMKELSSIKKKHPDKAQKIDEWTSDHFSDLNIRHTDLRRLGGVLLGICFGPLALEHLFGVLGWLSAINSQAIAALS
jgi:hypothetical protein